MKLALLLPGYIESPDYRHLVIIDESLKNQGYTTVRVDACNLWQTGDSNSYSTTAYINQVKDIISSYLSQQPTEIILVGHSLGCLVALLVGFLFDEVTKIICLSPPYSLNNSDHKWVDGFRVSKKDLPGYPDQFREFSVPVSFTLDRKQYSIPISFKNNHHLTLIIMGSDDPSTYEIEAMSTTLSNVEFIKIPGMGHDFRQSEDQCQQVAKKIVSFLKN